MSTLITATPWSRELQPLRTAMAVDGPVLCIDVNEPEPDLADLLTPVAKAKLMAAVDPTLVVIR